MEKQPPPQSQGKMGRMDEETVLEQPFQPDQEVDDHARLRVLKAADDVAVARRKKKKKSRIKALLSTFLLVGFLTAWTFFVHRRATRKAVAEAHEKSLIQVPGGPTAGEASALVAPPKMPEVSGFPQT